MIHVYSQTCGKGICLFVVTVIDACIYYKKFDKVRRIISTDNNKLPKTQKLQQQGQEYQHKIQHQGMNFQEMSLCCRLH